MKNAVILLTLILCAGCSGANEREAARQVKGVAASVRDVTDETGGFGLLSFLTKIDITASQDGTVKKIFYREGSFVPAGELVILLENPQIILALERAENYYSQAKSALDLARSRLLEGEFQAEAQLLAIEKADAELNRIRKQWNEDYRKHQNQETLFEAGGVNQEAILNGRFSMESGWDQILIMEKELEIRKIGCRDQDLAAAGIDIPENDREKKQALIALMTSSLKAECDSAISRLDAAEKEYRSACIVRDDLSIVSEAGGVVGGRYFEEGERVKAGEKILTLLDTSSLYSIFPVREKDALCIEKGMSARVHIDGIHGEKQGKVDLVYPQADSQSMSFMVRVLLEGETTELKPGMFSRVQVTLGNPRKGVFLPASALTGRKNNEADIYVINGDTLSVRKVVLGMPLNDQWEICSGLKAGEIVVLRPDSDMREGTFVSLAD